jgi:hypothetical protein
MHAYIHQWCVSHMTRESLEDFLIKTCWKKLGREQIGRHRWHRLSGKKQKLDSTHAILREKLPEGRSSEQAIFDKRL